MEGSRVLRERALDVVVDMLSDEIDAVRLSALEVSDFSPLAVVCLGRLLNRIVSVSLDQ